jgi:hypothetical protein
MPAPPSSPAAPTPPAAALPIAIPSVTSSCSSIGRWLRRLTTVTRRRVLVIKHQRQRCWWLVVHQEVIPALGALRMPIHRRWIIYIAATCANPGLGLGLESVHAPAGSDLRESLGNPP